ncbi:MAG TPA: hypothetical protein VHM20_07150 [Gammaproteobacteria bacterium]|jgi:hypothetical protein|nr:hypothetical protein [Gammaproteobacteria bacterium]
MQTRIIKAIDLENDMDYLNLASVLFPHYWKTIESEPSELSKVKSEQLIQFLTLQKTLENLLKATHSNFWIGFYHFHLGLLLQRCEYSFLKLTPQLNQNQRIKKILKHYIEAHRHLLKNEDLTDNENHIIEKILLSLPELVRVQLNNWELANPYLCTDDNDEFQDKKYLVEILKKEKKVTLKTNYSIFLKPVPFILLGGFGLVTYGSLGLIAGLMLCEFLENSTEKLVQHCKMKK